jgi:hypothetical protein
MPNYLPNWKDFSFRFQGEYGVHRACEVKSLSRIAGRQLSDWSSAKWEV